MDCSHRNSSGITEVSKHWGSFLRNMAIYEGNELLTGAFHATMDKIEADIL